MKILSKVGDENIATVYLADLGDGRVIECVESVQPPIPRQQKWVLIVSTLVGCPVRCQICDAGASYQGKLSEAEILDQIDFLIRRRYPDGNVPVEKFKIQFARMGEPAFNPNVLRVLEKLPSAYHAPGLIASLSTVAPCGTDRFFEKLRSLKVTHYPHGRFQLQFSIHSTDPDARDRLMPVKKWSLATIADYGRQFFAPGDRKITLNFAPAKNVPLDPRVLADVFEPDKFVIKITPVNPTYAAARNNLVSYIDPLNDRVEHDRLLQDLRRAGFDVILSIGELEENKIGSNCGQYVSRYLQAATRIKNSYTYRMKPVA